MKDQFENLAPRYDDEAKKTGWVSPDVCFGLMYKYISQGEKLLDLGIGTGLSSKLHHQAGLIISGVDSSPAKLKICKDKGWISELKEADLNSKLPFSNNSFNHTISIGTLTFFENLNHIFQEVSRVTIQGGIFAFDIFFVEENGTCQYSWPERPHVKLYKHKKSYIKSLLKNYNFRKLNSIEYYSLKPKAEYNFVEMYIVQKN